MFVNIKLQNCRYELTPVHDHGDQKKSRKKGKKSQKENLDDLKRELEMVSVIFIYMMKFLVTTVVTENLQVQRKCQAGFRFRLRYRYVVSRILVERTTTN